MRLSIKVSDDVITEARFKVYGRSLTIATGSMAAELIQGKSVDEAVQIGRDDINEAVGGLPHTKIHCTTLAVDAIGSAITDYQRRQAG